MKKLLITLLLISPFSFADWGDVYYCQMTNNVGITPEGREIDYKLEKFTFKLDKTKNAMVFGEKSIFRGGEMTLIDGMTWVRDKKWYAESEYSKVYFTEDKFLFVMVVLNAITISADCEKF
jgi:hypothetical protein